MINKLIRKKPTFELDKGQLELITQITQTIQKHTNKHDDVTAEQIVNQSLALSLELKQEQEYCSSRYPESSSRTRFVIEPVDTSGEEPLLVKYVTVLVY